MTDGLYKSECSTLVEFLRWRALYQPRQHAYTFLLDGETQEVSWTYGELDQRSRAVAAALQGLEAQEKRVLLLYPPGLDYVAAFLGCLYAEAVAVPSYPPRLNRPDPRLQAIVRDAQATIALTDADILANLTRRFAHTPDLQALHWLCTENLDHGLAERWQIPEVNGDTLAFLQYTSGSTATPKGVMVSHGNLLHNLALIHECFEHTPDSQGVIWLPPYHDMGLIGGIMQPLYGGFPVTLMSPVAFLQKPIRWLQAISRYRATTSGGPNFAYDLCVQKVTPEQRATLDLSSWDLAFNGAEPIRGETMARFVVAFEPCGFRREAFYPCYGLAEATLIVSGGLKAAPPVAYAVRGAALAANQVLEVSPGDDDGRMLTSCGQTLTDQSIVIVDPETFTCCAPGRVGEIWVSGPSVAQGYWGQPQETAHTFQAYLADAQEGPFLRTGDLGFLKDGELFVTGRIKDLIIVRGQNHYPQDIERTVEQSHPALQPDCGAAFSVDVGGEERLVVVQELKRTQRQADVEEVAGAIRRAVNEAHELQVYAVVLVRPMSIPKTSSGKIQRHVCRVAFLENSLQVIGSSVLDAPPAAATAGQQEEERFIRKALMTIDKAPARHALLAVYLQEQVARLLRLSVSQVDLQQSLGALGLDALGAVELKYDLQTSLGVVLPRVDALQGLSISQLVPNIVEALDAPAGAPAAMVKTTPAR